MQKLTDEELLSELKRRFTDNVKAINELNKATAELKVLNDKLKESEAMKSHFISNISNEIVNPFTSIIGLTKNILEVKKEDWKTVISMVALINTEAFNLDFQLKNIFAAAKIEAGEIEPENHNINIKNAIQEVIENFKYESRKKKVSILNTCNCPDTSNEGLFRTDPEKLKLILSNLLSNALKYSYPNTQIIIKTTISEKRELIIIVQDFGEGISETNQQIIFDRFKRSDSGINSNIRGHGLGLSVNKALLDLLEGEIQVETQLGEGSTFTINIPEGEKTNEGMAHEGNEFIFDDGEIF